MCRCYCVYTKAINSLITTNSALQNVSLQWDTLARWCRCELTVAEISQILDFSGGRWL